MATTDRQHRPRSKGVHAPSGHRAALFAFFFFC
ncbi:hypothetical protein SBI_09821 [Streptomyces bingchenggensis BCW-1]|uniref:Uncharacterized protein n=1 Tax=Streptomyces bingchenggensis (strain BCW-1) TaxID=749414 RepID=D7CD97_STRBB|nr:hypothetical protein SBI_09821 [Streptomyces bingchenggensis BCW-1]